MSTDTLTPQIVGRAENAHAPVLARILARTGTTKNQWVALTLTVAAGGTERRDRLAGRVAKALKIDESAALGAIAELGAARLLADVPGSESQVGLTDAGRERYGQIRASVDEVVGRAYRDIPAGDLATAGRVLALITARLDAEAGGA